MAKEVKIKTVARYSGHSVRPNKSVDIGFKFDYGELIKYIQVVQMLNENVSITVKQSGSKPEVLGVFMVKQISIDHDGEAVIKFNSMTDSSEVQLMHHLVGDEPFQILLKAEIEENEEETEEE